jgi:Peptidoglycan-binding protein, CsiV
MRRSGLKLLLVAATALVLGPVSAEEPALQSYDVELVIFRNLGGGGTPEQWGIEAADANRRMNIPDDDAPVDTPSVPATPAAPANDFPAVPASKFKLDTIENSLRRSRGYQVIAHIGWTQPGFPRDTARFFNINALVPPTSGLIGQVALSRGRYLHLTLDLVYSPPTAGAESQPRYVLQQTRRMRSNERHYIDHPKFGVVAVITPST